MSLRYPKDNQGADYVAFKHFEYKGRGQGNQEGEDIVLYMPPGAAGVTNKENWNNTGAQFQGELGQFRRMMLTSLTMAEGTNLLDKDDVGKKINEIVENFKGAKGKLGPYVAQGYMEEMARQVGRSPNMLLSLTKGEIYNPNTELWYNGPQLRAFTLAFDMMPKDSGEASTVRNIVKEFKSWSAPSLSGGGKYKIPHVWTVSYGGQVKQFMNKFKPAALTDINVTYNAGLPMHMTFDDGSPLVTSIELNFMESALITREDHQGSPAGY